MEEQISGCEQCLQRCYVEARNCRQEDDGTWTCKDMNPESCEELCC